MAMMSSAKVSHGSQMSDCQIHATRMTTTATTTTTDGHDDDDDDDGEEWGKSIYLAHTHTHTHT